MSVMFWLSIALGFVAAGLWLYAARIKVPTNLVSSFGGQAEGLDKMQEGFRRQATWNSLAAMATAVAVLCQALANLIE
jgi:hypothetical protein